MELATKIIMFLRVDKIIISWKKFLESREERRDLEQKRRYKEIAIASKEFGSEGTSNYFEEQAKLYDKNRH